LEAKSRRPPPDCLGTLRFCEGSVWESSLLILTDSDFVVRNSADRVRRLLLGLRPEPNACRVLGHSSLDLIRRAVGEFGVD